MDKPTSIAISQDCYEYAPTSGVKELRYAVADLYNEIYCKDKESKYTYENVCIVPGGRAGLTRVAAVIGDVIVGYFLPETDIPHWLWTDFTLYTFMVINLVKLLVSLNMSMMLIVTLLF
jgi:hypothetical protein